MYENKNIIYNFSDVKKTDVTYIFITCFPVNLNYAMYRAYYILILAVVFFREGITK